MEREERISEMGREGSAEINGEKRDMKEEKSFEMTVNACFVI